MKKPNYATLISTKSNFELDICEGEYVDNFFIYNFLNSVNAWNSNSIYFTSLAQSGTVCSDLLVPTIYKKFGLVFMINNNHYFSALIDFTGKNVAVSDSLYPVGEKHFDIIKLSFKDFIKNAKLQV